MSMPESWKAWEGRTVEGKFPLRQYLGSSEHTAVFLTEGPDRKSKAVIKLIETKADDKEFARLEAAKKLSHPHLIRIFETGRSQLDGTRFVYATMEFADEDLSQILPQRALTPAEVSDLLPPLLDALTFLHGRGLVHSRIKPSNILAVGEQLKLSSDEITAVGAPDPARKRRDTYDAPETATGMLLQASDIWSLGQVMIEALTQKPAAGNPGSEQMAIPAVPEPFRAIARECLQVDPKRRCTLAEIYARLQPEARSVPHAATESPAASIAPGKRGSGLVISVAVVVVILVAIGVFLSRGKNAPVQNSDATKQPATQTALPASPTHEPAEAPKKASTAGEVRHQVIPEVPRSAQDTITGTIKVSVRVDVDASGKVTEAKFKTAGSSRYFAEQALRAARGWEFSPPLHDGQPSASAWLIHFRFRRSSIQASAEPTRR